MKEHTHTHMHGVMGEFETPEQLLAAAKKAREAGYKHIDAYTPFPIEGLAETIGFRWTAVPLITLLGGLGGGLTGFGLQYWVAAITYPQNIGGRPLNSWPAFIPVTFELTVLGASIFAVVGMLALNKLPQPYHPVFSVDRFAHASTDRFFLVIESRDAKFNLAETSRFLQSLSAVHVDEVKDEE
jgi:Alternative complex III, ActD subunit